MDLFYIEPAYLASSQTDKLELWLNYVKLLSSQLRAAD